MSAAADLFYLSTNRTWCEPGESDEGDDTEASSPCSFADSISRENDFERETITETTLMYSSGNLTNFSIVDSTLREGEQFATAYFDTLKIARL